MFIRFTGCNLWNGKQSGRHLGKAVCSTWCDTNFVGTDGQNGGVYSLEALVDKVVSIAGSCRYLVFTGGEPSLQLDESLIIALKDLGFYTAIETNGTHKIPDCLDWVTMSPKFGSQIVLSKCDELKVVYPQPWDYEELRRRITANHFFISPMNGADSPSLVSNAVQFILNNPNWRLSLQLHKIAGVP